MTASVEVTIDAVDADPVVTFWQAALGYDRLYERDPYIVLGPPHGDARPRLVIQRVPSVTPDKTPVHIDLRVDDPDAEVARLQALGATVEWVVDETPRRLHPLDDHGGSAGHAVLRMPRQEGRTPRMTRSRQGEVRGDRRGRARALDGVAPGQGARGARPGLRRGRRSCSTRPAIGAGPSGIACGVIRNNYFQPAMRELMAHSVGVWESDPEAFHYHPVGYMQIAPEVMHADVAQIHQEQQRHRVPVRADRGRGGLPRCTCRACSTTGRRRTSRPCSTRRRAGTRTTCRRWTGLAGEGRSRSGCRSSRPSGCRAPRGRRRGERASRPIRATSCASRWSWPRVRGSGTSGTCWTCPRPCP